MGLDNGNQQLHLVYKATGEAININKNFYNIIPTGIYTTPLLNIVSDTIVNVDPLIAFIKDDLNEIALKISTTTNAEITGVSDSTQFIIIRYEWIEDINYADFLAISIGDILPTDLVIGEAIYIGPTLTSFSYDDSNTAFILSKGNTQDLENDVSELTDLILYVDSTDKIKTETKDDFAEETITEIDTILEEDSDITNNFLHGQIKNTGYNFISDIAPLLNDLFGNAVKVNDNSLVIAAKGTSTNQGKVYLYLRKELDTFDSETSFTSPNSENNGYYGFELALNSDWLFVSAPFEDVAGETDQGNVYAYERTAFNNWSSPQAVPPLILTFPEPDINWGNSIGSDGDYAVISCNKSTPFSPLDFVAKIYQRNNSEWTGVHTPYKLLPNAVIAGEVHNTQVDISGDYVILGMPNKSTSGLVYVIKRTSDNIWDNTTLLSYTLPDASAKVGTSVSIYGDYLAVSAVDDDTLKGTVEVFKRIGDNSWSSISKIVSPELTEVGFGTKIKLYKTYLLISIPLSTEGGSNRGTTYLYQIDLDTVNRLSKINATTLIDDNNFGLAIDMDDTDIVINADTTVVGGSVDIFRKQGE